VRRSKSGIINWPPGLSGEKENASITSRMRGDLSLRQQRVAATNLWAGPE
jgi:hypothetical protein